MNLAYPTTDHWIPVTWFDVLWGEMETVETRRLERSAQAAAHGTQMYHSGDKPAVRSFMRDLHRRAFPSLWRRRKPAPPDES